MTRRAADVLLRRKKEAEAIPNPSEYVFPGGGDSGHVVSFQHPHKAAIEAAKLDPFPIYTFRHTFGTRSAQAGMDKYSLAALMGHSSPNLAARYYIHVTESHVAAGFGKFRAYAEQGIADGIKEAFPDATDAIQ